MHCVHHYPSLLERWRAVARTAGVRLHRYALAGPYPLFCLRTPALAPAGGVYISAGIHGDEPASSEALIAWAEGKGKRLRELPLMLFPCLNPWGLVNNIRLNAEQIDLNRSFHRTDLPEISAQRKLVHPYQFDLGLMLHEDFDGEGIYLYELLSVRPHWGEALLAAARPFLPAEPRSRVDRRKAVRGVIRRRFDKRRFEEIGYPEAIWLHQRHAVRNFTIETPSEFALERRVKAHMAVIDEALRLLGR
jgi:hypothetical protein